jgi:anti-anti-sigma factor
MDEECDAMSATLGAKGNIGPAFIQIERHGDVAIIVPTADLEAMQWDLVQQAAEIVLHPLRKDPASGIIVDLSKVAYFGSVFVSLLLRCHNLAKEQGNEMVLCGASERARELLKLTALDTFWAIYNDRDEALDALSA